MRASAPPPSAAQRRTRLGCEQLEDRLTPALVNYLGFTNGGFYDPLNWETTNQQTGQIVHRVPVNGDDVTFRFAPIYGPTQEYGYYPPQRVAEDCVIPIVMTLNSLSLSYYNGTVSVQDETRVGTLTLSSGKIKQLGSSATGYDFYVDQDLQFTGGVFNDSANTGILHLQNVTTGLIGGVTTGSTLKIEAGTTLQYTSATLSFLNEGTIHSFAGSVFKPFDPNGPVGNFVNINQPGGPISPAATVDGDYTLAANSSFAFLVTTNGNLKITKTLSISGNSVANQPNSASLAMNAGNIVVNNGVRITLEKGFAMNGGTFSSVQAAGYTGAQTVYITGNVGVYGGTIQLGSLANKQFGALYVTGDVSFTGGEFQCKVNGTPTSEERDLWKCTGKFTIGAAAKVTPTVLYEPEGGVVGHSWSVIIAGSFANATMPAPTATPVNTPYWPFSESATDLILTSKKAS